MELLETNISKLFDADGQCIGFTGDYFDSDGDLKDWVLISKYYSLYPAKSDIVRMHYAESHANETNSSYSAETLFYRGT